MLKQFDLYLFTSRNSLSHTLHHHVFHSTVCGRLRDSYTQGRMIYDSNDEVCLSLSSYSRESNENAVVTITTIYNITQLITSILTTPTSVCDSLV